MEIRLAHTSIPAVFREQAAALRSRPMVYSKATGHWRPLTWAQMDERVRHAAAGLVALGIEPGERVAILANSSVEWVLADLASLSAAAVDVPIPETSTQETVGYILGDADCTLAFVGTPALLDRLLTVRPAALRFVVTFFEPAEPIEVEGLTALSLLELERLGQERGTGAEVDARVGQLGSDDLLTLIYTSGTTGEPKGVMLTHGNIIANCEGCARALPVRSDDVLLSFLPLSHSFERTCGYYMASLFAGATIYYAESVGRLFRDIAEVRPTLMTGVPRVYERIYARFAQARQRAGTLRRVLLDAGVAIGREVARARQGGRRPALPWRIGYRLTREQIFDPLTEPLGGRVRFFVSGGAPLAAEIGAFFLAAGVLILEGYGLTEAAPVISVNRPHDVRFGTVGRPLDNVRVRIADDGEILVSGPNVMRGYYRRDEETAAAVVDGWLHTGDIGLIDREGRLCITDRKKDLFKSSGAKYIAPQRLEGLMSRLPLVEQVCVVGDRRPWCGALIVPDRAGLTAWAAARGIEAPDFGLLLRHPEVIAQFDAELASLDDQLERHEQLRSHLLVAEPFTAENGLLTTSLKIRRRAILTHYQSAIEAMYAAGPRIRRRPG